MHPNTGPNIDPPNPVQQKDNQRSRARPTVFASIGDRCCHTIAKAGIKADVVKGIFTQAYSRVSLKRSDTTHGVSWGVLGEVRFVRIFFPREYPPTHSRKFQAFRSEIRLGRFIVPPYAFSHTSASPVAAMASGCTLHGIHLKDGYVAQNRRGGGTRSKQGAEIRLPGGCEAYERPTHRPPIPSMCASPSAAGGSWVLVPRRTALCAAECTQSSLLSPRSTLRRPDRYLAPASTSPPGFLPRLGRRCEFPRCHRPFFQGCL